MGSAGAVGVQAPAPNRLRPRIVVPVLPYGTLHVGLIALSSPLKSTAGRMTTVFKCRGKLRIF
jgi:hypothetical protein